MMITVRKVGVTCDRPSDNYSKARCNYYVVNVGERSVDGMRRIVKSTQLWRCAVERLPLDIIFQLFCDQQLVL